MSDVSLLPKYQFPDHPGEDPDVVARELHEEENKAWNQARKVKFAPYVFRPYPVALYRDWDEGARRRELNRIASISGVSLNDERGMLSIEDMLPEHETKLLGRQDCDEQGNVNQQLRDANDGELHIALGQGWATTPDGVRKAANDFRIKTTAIPAAERAYDDRRMGEKAQAEVESLGESLEDHVVDVGAARAAVAVKKGGR